jgi:ABC-type amino acid transport substrate-binding protein
MNGRGIVSLVLAAALVFGAGAPAAADGLEDARRRGRLVVGVKADFPPFGYKDGTGRIVGFDVEIARLLARALFGEDGRLELVEVTSGSRIPFLYSNWVDLLVATMTVTEDRQRVLEFSEPYFLSGSLLLVPLVPDGSGIRDLADIDGKRVAVVEGSVQVEDLRQVAPGALLEPFDTVPEAVAALKGGGVDAFCQDDVLVVSLDRANPDLVAVGKPFLPRPYAAAVRKGETVFARWIGSQLEKSREEGVYGRLWQTHFGEMQEHLLIP